MSSNPNARKPEYSKRIMRYFQSKDSYIDVIIKMFRVTC